MVTHKKKASTLFHPGIVMRLCGAESKERVFQIVADELSASMDCDTISIYEMDFERNALRPRIMEGGVWKHVRAEDLTISVNQGIIGSVAVAGKGEVIHHAHLDPRSYYPSGMNVQSEQMIAIPMFLGKLCVAVLAVSRFSKQKFKATEFDQVQFLASASSMALNTIKLVSELQTKESHLKTLLHSIPDHPLHVDENGMILTQDISFPSGYNTIYEVFPVYVVDQFLAHIKAIANGLPSSGFEYQIELDNASQYYFEARIIPIQKNQFLLLSREITTLKRNEVALQRAKQEAERLMMAKQDFLARMSHELRTPLNGVIGLANLLDQSGLTKENKEYVNGILYSGEHLRDVINDILDLSKIEAGKMEMEQKDFSPATVIQNVLKMIEPQADAKQTVLTSSLDGLPGALFGDEVRLKQVLLNLLSNAVKFTERGEVTLQVKTIPRKDDEVLIQFSVRDTGIGIAEERLVSIFENFVQASASTSVEYGGTGLGLAIVKKLAELQGGTVSVASTPGKGSTFTVSIPYRLGNATLLSRNDTAPLHRFDNARILVVEDNMINQLVVKRTLENWGLTVVLASNGLDAIQKLRTEVFDIVAMDVQMPVMDGFEATRVIRTELPPPVRSIPIIAMTASVLYDPRARVKEVGMDDYISKPFKPADLNHLLAQFLRSTDVRIKAREKTEEDSEIDWSYLEKVSPGNSEFKVQVVDLFKSEGEKFLVNLELALTSNNVAEVARLAHAFKPVGSYIGFKVLPQKIGELEALARTASTHELKNISEDIKKMVARTIDKLNNIKQTLKI